MMNRLSTSESRVVGSGVAALAGMFAVVFVCGCPQGPPASRTFSSDTTIDELIIAAEELNLIRNDAVVTVTGDATIDGTLQSSDGRLTLIVEGNLTVNGELRATAAAPNDAAQDDAFEDQPSGIFIIVPNGTITFDGNSSVFSTGPVVITDDESLLEETPEDLYDEVEEVGGEDIPTVASVSPENAPFGIGPRAVAPDKLPVLQQDADDPITISGDWPPAGSNLIPGDRPVVVLKFNGARPLVLDGWTVNGPPAPAGQSRDQSQNPGMDATGSDGRDGLRLNIRNNGGPINVVNNVVLNLAGGGDGGGARTVCGGDATGGNGGTPGTFRMSAGGGIDFSAGRLTVNPGKAGDGGSATVEAGEPGADGCPGEPGEGGTARGGTGADNRRRLFVRGIVTAIERVDIGPLRAGDGGDATAEACDGGNGEACCDAGGGAVAMAIGGNGGDASLDLAGLPVDSELVSGGHGGEAEAIGGHGGSGGDCKFDDAGDGGDGADATATAGDGGTASNSGDGGAEGGDGGDAVAMAGDGGDGGDSGFGTVGQGGDRGRATAEGGNGGAATTAGTDGDEEDNDGADGDDGEALPTVIYCLRLVDFLFFPDAVILPGQYEGPVTEFGSPIIVGDIDIAFLPVAGAEYESASQPAPNVGIAGGTLAIDLASFMLDVGEPGLVRGIRIEPLSSTGISVATPLGVRVIGQGGTVIEAQSVAALPDNTADPNDPLGVEVFFETEMQIFAIELIVPGEAFVSLMRVYLLDP